MFPDYQYMIKLHPLELLRTNTRWDLSSPHVPLPLHGEAGSRLGQGGLPRAAGPAKCLQRVHGTRVSAYLEHTGISLGPELAHEQVGGESCQDGERYQAAGESPVRAAPGCQPGSGLGRAAAFHGQHFHTGCFPEAQPQILGHPPAGPGAGSDSPWAERPSIK